MIIRVLSATACVIALFALGMGLWGRRRMRRRFEAVIDADEKLITSLIALLEVHAKCPVCAGTARIVRAELRLPRIDPTHAEQRKNSRWGDMP